VKFFLTNNSDASFDEIYQMLKPFARRQAAMFIAMLIVYEDNIRGQ
jgi:hypothetical protein